MSTFESLIFYRGVSEDNPTDHPYIKQTRKNRKPRASSQHFHNIANQWFIQKFGISYRSEAIFVTSLKLSATTYAATEKHLVRVIPISAYRYCWSSKISDLLFAAKELENASEENIKRTLDFAEYREDDLQEAHKSGHEVMLFCEEYICIPEPPNLMAQKTEKSFILLPSKY